jgi:hypothetical protein
MVVGAVGYLLAGNALALRRHRATVDATAASTEPYIATRTPRPHRQLQGRGRGRRRGSGSVFITDEDDPDFLHEIGWMKTSDARELARGLGHAFNTDQLRRVR